jgi:hypothetical protein
MSLRLLAAAILLALTVIVHVVGLTAVFRWLTRTHSRPTGQFWALIWLVIRTVWWLVAVHLVEIAVWALFYWREECMPDLESAFYFAGVTYTTVGYGDLVLPKEWRLLGPVEGLAGILMCGLSTGFFFALVSRLYAPQKKDAQA